MAKIMCKICGEMIRIEDNDTIIKCANCGGRQTLPHYNNIHYVANYAEVNTLRQCGSFEKASEKIDILMKEDSEDSELYWQRLLCRYGIVYLQNSVKRTYSLQCIMPLADEVQEDEDYKKALQYSSEEQNKIYTIEAKKIERLRKKQRGESIVLDLSEPSMESGFTALEEEDWEMASAQFDQALKETPDDANLYLGKLMAELQIRREEELFRVGTAMESAENYANVLKCADDALRRKITTYNMEAKYRRAVELKNKAEVLEDFISAKALFEQLGDYQGSDKIAVECEYQIQNLQMASSRIIIGCRDAATLESDPKGERIVHAKYYYDIAENNIVELDNSKKTHKSNANSGSSWSIGLLIGLGLGIVVGLAVGIMLSNIKYEPYLSSFSLQSNRAVVAEISYYI